MWANEVGMQTRFTPERAHLDVFGALGAPKIPSQSTTFASTLPASLLEGPPVPYPFE